MRHCRTLVPLALCLLAALSAGCDGDATDYSNKAKKPKGPSTPVPPEKNGKAEDESIVFPAYEPPADSESHRLDMVDFERQAYSTLRKFSVGQRAFSQDINPLPVDLDGDGVGEFGFLLELMGVSFCRTPGGLGRAPVRMSWPLFKATDEKEQALVDKKAPPGPAFVKGKTEEYLVDPGGVVFRIDSRGIAVRGGYCFLFFLPGKKTARNAGKLVPDGDKSLADLQERYFAGIAWPLRNGVTGRRVFFTQKFEQVWSRWNIEPALDGRKVVPSIWDPLDKNGKDPKNLVALIAHVDSGLTPSDGGAWRFYGEKKGKKDFEWKWPKEREIAEWKADGGGDEPWMKGKEKKRKPAKDD